MTAWKVITADETRTFKSFIGAVDWITTLQYQYIPYKAEPVK